MKESFKIPYPQTKKGMSAWCKCYGLNAYYSGKAWQVRKKDAEFWHWQTIAAMRKDECRTTPFNNPVVITFLWNDNMDMSNHAAIAKMIEDGMKGRLIADDSRKYVKGIEHYWHDAPYIKVIVTEVEENERN